MRGAIRINPGTSEEIWLPNQILTAGQEAFLDMIATGATGIIAGGGNFYFGLCNVALSDSAVLTDIVGISEPTIGTNGYARATAARNGTGWPTIGNVNGEGRAQSAQFSFTGSGGSFDRSYDRVFMTNVASGTGTLLAITQPIETPVTIIDGQTVNMQYELWL